MGRSTLKLGLVLSIGLAGGCNSILDAGEPTVVSPPDSDHPTDDGGDAGDAGGGVAAPTCGDGRQDDGEQCDDGNDDPNDGCDACVRPCGAKPELLDPDSGHCYRISDTELQQWGLANQACEAWGGSLVSLESNDELAFVQNRVAADTWVGASATGSDPDTFAWLSGEVAVFDPTPEGEGDCIKLLGESFEFVREDCEASLHFICERGSANP